jgi:hypothetical protein
MIQKVLGDDSKSFVFQDFTGPAFSLKERWRPEMVEIVQEWQITKLCMGPENHELSFVKDLPHLVNLSITHDGFDLTPIYDLQELSRLDVYQLSGFNLDISRFPKLSQFLTSSSDCISGLQSCSELRFLATTGSSDEQLDQISRLSNLRILHLSGCRSERLGCLERLTDLRRLCLDRFRNLNDLDFLKKMPLLRHLSLTRCPSVSSIGPVDKLEILETIRLDIDVMTDLRPLSVLANLEAVIIYENPCLSDELLASILQLPKLRLLTIDGREIVNSLSQPGPVSIEEIRTSWQELLWS